MLKSSSILILFVLTTYSANRIIYLDPLPGSKYVSNENTIVLGFEQPVEFSYPDIIKHITISGSIKGTCRFTAIISTDKKKVILKPVSGFVFGEKVTVRIDGLPDVRRNFEYSFSISSGKIDWDPLKSIERETPPQQNGMFAVPSLVVRVNNNPAEGCLFSCPWYINSNLMIANKDGVTQWFLPLNGFCGDFKKQPNGNLTYFDGVQNKFFELNSSYQTVHSYACGNGYTADIHELRVMNNGNALLMAYDPQRVDMSGIIPGGNPEALVIGLIIQELDINSNVVFQWRSWDHFAITDATHENFLDSIIDYVHGNAIEIDNDGNLMLSSRSMDEITKINRTNGDLIWRLGGKNNQFVFTNDTMKFSHQHAIRRISNGNITLFDNGNYHVQQISRAIEYSIDEVNKTVQLVWQYRNTPPIFGIWGGYVQRLYNGNTLISWGGTTPTITEVDPSGTIVFEASYPFPTFTYRAFKYDWSFGHTSSGSGNNNVPESFRLYQNYPNPFNPSTTISFDIASASEVELVICDITGSLIQSKKLGYTQPGSYSVTIDGDNFASGLYFYTLKAGSFISTRKMILLK